jgi:signal transduction histidine kinase
MKAEMVWTTKSVRFFRDTLPGQFLFAGGLVMVAGALIVGTWVSNRIEQGVVQNSGAAAAHYMESLLSPLAQDLADAEGLSPPARLALSEIFSGTSLGKRVVSYKIWKKGGLIVEASDENLRGQRFEPSDDLNKAWGGQIAASFEDLTDHEDQGEAALGIPLLEVYSPIHAFWTGEVIAVAEFYERADDLATELADVKRQSWLIVLSVFSASGLLLYGIVHAGGRLIARQQTELRVQLDESNRIATQNARLRERVMQAAQRSTAQADRVMQRIGQDLHDGVAQHLSLASLRFEEARPVDTENAGTVRQALDAAMTELRAISRGLALPDIDQLDMKACIRRAVEDHRKVFQSNAKIGELQISGKPQSYSMKLCAYRFVQETLANASRHAEASKIRVDARDDGQALTVSITDNGSGFDPETQTGVSDTGGQGLPGLRDRAATLNGHVDLESKPGNGTTIRLTLPLEEVTP